MRHAPRRSYRWLHDLLDVLYSDIDVETAINMLRDPALREELPNLVPGVDLLVSALPDVEPREFDNLLVALLSLRVKFSQDDAHSKVEVNVAMREGRRQVRYGRKTSASVTEVMRRAREQFGPNGVGLRQSGLGILTSTYSGELGTVEIAVRPVFPGVNEVGAASQAYDDEVAQFLRSLPSVTVLTQLRWRKRSKIKPSAKP